MTHNNHTDQLDRRLDRVHRVFMDDHGALRQDLLDRLDEAPADLPVGAIPFNPSKKRKWIMRSSIGLAAAVAIAAIIVISLFGSGPASPSIAWAEVRENVENATAMHARKALVVVDADGKVVQRLDSMERWNTDDGRNRTLTFNDVGEPTSESIVTPKMVLFSDHTSKHVSLQTSGGGVLGSNKPRMSDNGPSAMLKTILLLADDFAEHAGQERLDGRLIDRFHVTMADLTRFVLREQGIENPDEKQVLNTFGGSAEELASMPPVSLWIDKEAGLPIRVQIPEAPSKYDDLNIDVPEDGRVLEQIDILDWNEEVDPSVFDVHIPEGWTQDRTHVAWFSDRSDIGPDALAVAAGTPLAEGVTFRLFDQEDQLIATESDVLGVIRFTHLTGHHDGVTEPEVDRRSFTLRFTDAVQQRINKAVPVRREWAYQLGERITGKGRVWEHHSVPRGGDKKITGELELFSPGDLTLEQFREQYLAEE